jgi:hypothetical protein
MASVTRHGRRCSGGLQYCSSRCHGELRTVEVDASLNWSSGSSHMFYDTHLYRNEVLTMRFNSVKVRWSKTYEKEPMEQKSQGHPGTRNLRGVWCLGKSTRSQEVKLACSVDNLTKAVEIHKKEMPPPLNYVAHANAPLVRSYQFFAERARV